MMYGIQFSVRSISGVLAVSNLTCETRPVPSSLGSCLVKLGRRRRTNQCRRSRLFVISCSSYHGSFGSASSNNDEQDHDFVEASLLLSETISHYRMRKGGFQQDTRRQSSRQFFPLSFPAKESRQDVNVIGQALLGRFQSPTMFLKVSCDGHFLLPVGVGEFAIEQLIDATLYDGGHRDCPSQFEFLSNLVVKLGYEVKMVRITERVTNTYFARIYFSQTGEKDMLTVDAHPSDAINVAKRCKAPIYVSKQIILTDAIRIAYGMGRLLGTKSVYDVTLDSPEDGPDILAKELDLMNSMKLAVLEERYTDAANWRNELMKLLQSRQEC